MNSFLFTMRNPSKHSSFEYFLLLVALITLRLLLEALIPGQKWPNNNAFVVSLTDWVGQEFGCGKRYSELFISSCFYAKRREKFWRSIPLPKPGISLILSTLGLAFPNLITPAYTTLRIRNFLPFALIKIKLLSRSMYRGTYFFLWYVVVCSFWEGSFTISPTICLSSNTRSTG